MKITRDNYEQYFLDHAEGALSPEMERELALFLELNPDLKPVLEDFDASPLPKLHIKNETLKNRLKKNIHPTLHIDEAHVDEWLIRETEGLLSKTESAELEEFISLNPAYAFDRKMYSLTKASPDLSVTYPEKSALKKKAPVFTLTRLGWASAAAAAVILLVIGVRYLDRHEVAPVPQDIQAHVQENPQDIPDETSQVAVLPVEEKKEIIIVEPQQPLHQQMASATPAASRQEPFRMTYSETVAVIVSVTDETAEPVFYAYTPRTMEFPEEKQGSSVVAKMFGKMVLKARNAVRGNPDLNRIREADISLWTLAEAGVKGFNTISDRDLELIVRKDDEGNIKSYALVEEDRLLLTRNRGNN